MRWAPKKRRRERSRRALLVSAGAAVLGEAVLTKRRSGRLGGSIVVRCNKGHLFTTLWIPGASLKSLRLGWWRIQYCPVGRHLAVVVPVRKAELTDEQRRAASEHHDIRIP